MLILLQVCLWLWAVEKSVSGFSILGEGGGGGGRRWGGGEGDGEGGGRRWGGGGGGMFSSKKNNWLRSFNDLDFISFSSLTLIEQYFVLCFNCGLVLLLSLIFSLSLLSLSLSLFLHIKESGCKRFKFQHLFISMKSLLRSTGSGWQKSFKKQLALSTEGSSSCRLVHMWQKAYY